MNSGDQGESPSTPWHAIQRSTSVDHSHVMSGSHFEMTSSAVPTDASTTTVSSSCDVFGATPIKRGSNGIVSEVSSDRSFNGTVQPSDGSTTNKAITLPMRSLFRAMPTTRGHSSNESIRASSTAQSSASAVVGAERKCYSEYDSNRILLREVESLSLQIKYCNLSSELRQIDQNRLELRVTALKNELRNLNSRLSRISNELDEFMATIRFNNESGPGDHRP